MKFGRPNNTSLVIYKFVLTYRPMLGNPETFLLEKKESGLSLTIRIRNLSSIDKESAIQYCIPESMSRNPEFKTVLDSVTWSETNIF